VINISSAVSLGMSAASGNRLAASRWQTDPIRLSAVAARKRRTMKVEIIRELEN
jgi:hypothetical protein